MVIVEFPDKSYHAAITNYSLWFGERAGFINGSQLSDLIIENPDFDHCLITIYLSILGFNKGLNLTYDEFLSKFEWSEWTEKNIGIVGEVYNLLIMQAIDIKENQFAKGIQASTSKFTKNKEVIKPLTLRFECASDRYVIYCLSYGIDPDVFWYFPIADVERIFEGIQAYRAWQANPKGG